MSRPKEKFQGETELYARFGIMVRDRRLKKNITQAQLGEAVGVSKVWVCELEKGESRVTLSDALNLLKILRMPLRALKGVA